MGCSITANGLRIKDVKNAIAEMFKLPTMFVAFFISFNTLLLGEANSLFFKFLFFVGGETF